MVLDNSNCTGGVLYVHMIHNYMVSSLLSCHHNKFTCSIWLTYLMAYAPIVYKLSTSLTPIMILLYTLVKHKKYQGNFQNKMLLMNFKKGFYCKTLGAIFLFISQGLALFYTQKNIHTFIDTYY